MLRPESALSPLGGVREDKPELRAGNDDAVDSATGGSVLPHGLLISLGIEAEVDTEGMEPGWKPNIRGFGLEWGDEIARFTLEELCAVSAIIVLRSTLRQICSQQRRHFRKTLSLTLRLPR